MKSNVYVTRMTVDANFVGSQNVRSRYNVSQVPENVISKFLRNFGDIFVHNIKSFTSNRYQKVIVQQMVFQTSSNFRDYLHHFDHHNHCAMEKTSALVLF